MLYSNERKLALSGWLEENCPTAYDRPLKLQKFLFLYEMFSKLEDDFIDLNHLRGYKRGPVFSHVYGDYTHDRDQFNIVCLETYRNKPELINEKRAKRSSFICSSLTDKELSDFTHQLDVWSSKSDYINSGVHNVSLFESDISSTDMDKISILSSIFTDDIINNSSIVTLGSKHYLFSKADMDKLTEEHMDILWNLSDSNELYNPVFASIDNEGRLVLD